MSQAARCHVSQPNKPSQNVAFTVRHFCMKFLAKVVGSGKHGTGLGQDILSLAKKALQNRQELQS